MDCFVSSIDIWKNTSLFYAQFSIEHLNASGAATYSQSLKNKSFDIKGKIIASPKDLSTILFEGLGKK